MRLKTFNIKKISNIFMIIETGFIELRLNEKIKQKRDMNLKKTTQICQDNKGDNSNFCIPRTEMS